MSQQFFLKCMSVLGITTDGWNMDKARLCVILLPVDNLMSGCHLYSFTEFYVCTVKCTVNVLSNVLSNELSNELSKANKNLILWSP